MTITLSSSPRMAPADVFGTLKKHILVDGFHLVADLQRCHGAYLYDALGERELMDLFTCFSTSPLGYNHPGLDDEAFRDALMQAAINKPSNSDNSTKWTPSSIFPAVSTPPGAAISPT